MEKLGVAPPTTPKDVRSQLTDVFLNIKYEIKESAISGYVCARMWFAHATYVFVTPTLQFLKYHAEIMTVKSWLNCHNSGSVLHTGTAIL